MTSDEVRRILREELHGQGVAVEFADLVKVETGDSGEPIEWEHEAPSFCEATDDIVKFFQTGPDERELHKLNRSRMTPTRNAPPESKPAEETSCETFFDCEKRSSSPSTVKLTKRLIETGEVMVEHWNREGTCIATTFLSADAIDEGEPLAKAAITSEMYATLSKLRNAMSRDEITAAEKAIRSLDVSGFLQIIRAAKSAA